MSYLSKFYGIKFPAFALYSVPFDYKIGTDTIQIQKREFHDWYIIDRFDRNKTVLERYLSVKSDEINFDATCLNLTHVINKPVKWLIDSKAKIYDVSKKQKFISKSLPIIKVSKNAGTKYSAILSTKIFDEGISCHRLDTLMFTCPGNNYAKLEQRIGRILRRHPDKKDPLVIIFDDVNSPAAHNQVNNLVRVLKQNEFKYSYEDRTLDDIKGRV